MSNSSLFEIASREKTTFGFEQIVFCQDEKVGLKAIISIHSTVLGPAVGGCRMWDYANETEALRDVLRLSQGMTYKSAVAGLNWGGGKAVILGDPNRHKTPELLKRFGEFVDTLSGRYVTAKDVGIGSVDLKTIKTKTQYALGIEGEPGSSGDPSPATAWGVYHGIKACVEHALGARTLSGVTVALQGLGAVSLGLLEHLKSEGAKVIACDVNPHAVERAAKKFGIEIVKPEAIYDVPCDVFSPSALGGSISFDILPRLRTKIIAGGANNQLNTPEVGAELSRRGIVYAPDYVINAGGIINIYYERKGGGGYNRNRAYEHISQIGQTIQKVLKRAEADRRPTFEIANQMAEERIRSTKNEL